MKNNVHGKIGFCFVILAALCLIVGIVLIIFNQKPISNNSKKESSSNESVIEDYNLNMSNNSDFLVDKYIKYSIPETYEQFSEKNSSIVEKVYDADEKCSVRIYQLNYKSFDEFSKEFMGFYQLNSKPENVVVNNIKWNLLVVDHSESKGYYYVTEYKNKLILYVFVDYNSTNCIKDKDLVFNIISFK